MITGLLVPTLQRLKVSPVLGFLVAGWLIGPYGLAQFTDTLPFIDQVLITDIEGVRALSEVGIVFLLFMIGLELSFERLVAMRRLVFGLGSAQIVVSAVVIGVIASLWGNSVEASIVLGSCLALSSTAIVMQLLTEQRRFGSPVGHNSFAVLLAQDLAVVPLLFIVTLLGNNLSDSVFVSLMTAIMQAMAAVLIIVGLGRLLLRPLFAYVGQLRSPEAFMAITLLLIAVTSLTTHAAGLSAALGAFLAGILLAETEYRHEIEHMIAPFKGMLLGLFFLSIGMGIDVSAVVNNWFWTIASVFGLIGLKAAITTLLMRAFGSPWSISFESGLLLGQGGEFAFVIITLAVSLAVLPVDTAQFMLIVVSCTMLLTPLIAQVAKSVGERISQPGAGDLDSMPSELRDHIVICGYGRIGQLLAQLTEQQKLPHVALEVDTKIVSDCRRAGIAIFHADASRPGILEQVNIHTAAAFVITMDDHDAAEQVLKSARQAAPNIPIVMRARDSEHARQLVADGANEVIPEVLEAGLQMGQVLLQHIGFPAETAKGCINEQREFLTHLKPTQET